MLITMCFQGSMLNVYHPYGSHLKGRAIKVTSHLCFPNNGGWPQLKMLFQNIIQQIMELNIIITTHSWCENVDNQSGLGSPILCNIFGFHE